MCDIMLNLCAFVHIQGSMDTEVVSWTAMFCCLICIDLLFSILYMRQSDC